MTLIEFTDPLQISTVLFILICVIIIIILMENYRRMKNLSFRLLIYKMRSNNKLY